MAEERLQKILSQAGVSSRRHAEQLIVEGRVVVNGSVVTQLGSKADFERDHIRVDGRLLRPPKHLVYIALHKPNGTVSTVTDPENRETVMDLIRGVKERVYPVGRLDYHSEGLLLFTNDGDLANAVMSAATHLPKTYLVKVNGLLTADQEQKFRDGVPLSGRRTMPAGLKLIRQAENPWYEVKLHEGRNNQIRIMFKHFGRLVEKLKRVRIGPIDLGPIKPGQFRYLDNGEVEKLKRAAQIKTSQAQTSQASADEVPIHRTKPGQTKPGQTQAGHLQTGSNQPGPSKRIRVKHTAGKHFSSKYVAGKQPPGNKERPKA